MKKILILSCLVVILGALGAYAEGSLTDYANDVDGAWYGQKPVTDQEFDETVKRLESKQNKKSEKKKLKGNSLYKNMPQTDYLDAITQQNVLLGIPLELMAQDGSEIPPGHYTIKGKRDKNKVYLEFWQSYLKVATILARETNNDFQQKSLNFVKLLPYDQNRVKIIFGSVEFNAYAFVNINNP